MTRRVTRPRGTPAARDRARDLGGRPAGRPRNSAPPGAITSANRRARRRAPGGSSRASDAWRAHRVERRAGRPRPRGGRARGPTRSQRRSRATAHNGPTPHEVAPTALGIDPPQLQTGYGIGGATAPPGRRRWRRSRPELGRQLSFLDDHRAAPHVLARAAARRPLPESRRRGVWRARQHGARQGSIPVRERTPPARSIDRGFPPVQRRRAGITVVHNGLEVLHRPSRKRGVATPRYNRRDERGWRSVCSSQGPRRRRHHDR